MRLPRWLRSPEPPASLISDASAHVTRAGGDDLAEVVRALRARIMLQALFTDRLVVADAHALDNVALRSLVWDVEAVPDCPADLSTLITAGRLVVAKRDRVGEVACRSLAELRDWQANRPRPVSDVPTPEYARRLDQLCDGQYLDWSLERVGARFTTTVVDELRVAADADLAPSFRATAGAAYDWAQGRPLVLFNDFRQWCEENESALDRSMVDAIDARIAERYELSFPETLGLRVTASAGKDSPLRHVVLRAVGSPADEGRSDPPSCYTLDPAILARLPVEVIQEAAQSTERADLMRALANPKPDWSAVERSFYELMHNLDHAALSYLAGGGHEDVVGHVRRLRPKVRLRNYRSFLAEAGGGVLIQVVTGLPPLVGAVLEVGLVAFGAARETHSLRRESVAEQRRDRDTRQTWLDRLHPDRPRLVTFPEHLVQYDGPPDTLSAS